MKAKVRRRRIPRQSLDRINEAWSDEEEERVAAPEPSPGGWDDGTSSDDDDAATMTSSAKGGKAKAKGEPAGKAPAAWSDEET